MHHRGIVHKNVDPSEVGKSIANQAAAEGFILQIAGQQQTLASGSLDGLDHLFPIGLLLREPMHSYSRPIFRQLQSDSPANALS